MLDPLTTTSFQVTYYGNIFIIQLQEPRVEKMIRSAVANVTQSQPPPEHFLSQLLAKFEGAFTVESVPKNCLVLQNPS